jgi:hypothetical protein
MTLRRVTVEGAVAPVDPGQRPDLRWLPVTALVIDDSYQREITRPGHIRRIAEAFTWAHFSPLMVAPRADGTFAIIDGQHRAHAALMAGQAEVPCLVAQMSAAGEARAFAAVNGLVQKVTGIAMYRAALSAGEHWAVAVDAFGQTVGATVMRYQPAAEFRRPGVLTCVALIRAELTRDKGKRLRRVFDVVNASALAAEDVWYWQERFLKGLMDVLAECPHLTARQLAAWVDTGEPRKLMLDAELLRGQPAYRGKSLPALRQMVMSAAVQRRFGGGVRA